VVWLEERAIRCDLLASSKEILIYCGNSTTGDAAMLPQEVARTDTFNALLAKLEESIMSRQEQFLKGKEIRPVGRPTTTNTKKQIAVYARLDEDKKVHLFKFLEKYNLCFKDWLANQIMTQCKM
jgi:hypothetical protein